MIPNNSSYVVISTTIRYLWMLPFTCSAASPCRWRRQFAYATGTDMDGEAGKSPPSMGADEVYDADFVGALYVAIHQPDYSARPIVPWRWPGLITGRAAGLEWSFGDGTSLPMSVISPRTWPTPAITPWSLRPYNHGTIPAVFSANLVIRSCRWITFATAHFIFPCRPPMAFNSSSTDRPTPLHGRGDHQSRPARCLAGLQTITSTGGVVQLRMQTQPM